MDGRISLVDRLTNTPPLRGRPRSLERKGRGCVRRYHAQLCTWAICEVDSGHLRARLENVGELEGRERGNKLVGEENG